jgi:curli biogenesis system outer membrane secretion channel CsgG
MISKTFSFITLAGIVGFVAMAQTTPTKTPATTRSSAPKPNPQVDAVIEMVKGGLSEPFIIKKLVRENQPINLTTADMLKLNQARVSEKIMNAMMDPTAAAAEAAPAPTPVPPPTAPAPVAAAAAPEPLPATPAAQSAAPVDPAPASTPAAPAPAGTADKKRVAVDAFDYSAVMTQIQAVFGSQQNIGKGIQAMLTTRVTKAGKLIVVERGKLDQIKAEQDINQGNRNKQGVGARMGRIRGADAVLAGDITIFGRDDKQIGASGGGCKAWSVTCGMGGLGIKKDKAVVAINYRLIDAETSEVIASGEARGESKRSGLMAKGGGGDYWRGHGGGAIDMTSSDFGETIIGEATKACVDKLADILNEQATTMHRTIREVETSVVDVSGNTLMIGAGENDGVSVGEIFEIHHVLRTVKDPATQEVLDRKTEMIGQLTITSVRPKVATGSYTGSAPAPTTDFVAIKRVQATQ